MSFRPLRALVAACLLVGWLFATNHCALGLMKGSAAHAGCQHCAPAHKAPAGEKVRECCKELSGVVLPAAYAVKPAPEGAAISLEWLAWSEGPREPLVRESEWDTGPPRVGWFAETVLQHALQGNAPPHFG